MPPMPTQSPIGETYTNAKLAIQYIAARPSIRSHYPVVVTIIIIIINQHGPCRTDTQ